MMVNTNIIILAAVNFTFLFLSIFYYFFIYRNKERDEEIASRNPTIITNQFSREYWFWITDLLFRLILFLKIKPNAITIVAFIFGLITALLFSMGKFGIAGWVLILAGTLDSMDGRIARKLGLNSKAGEFFDSVMDRYTDNFIFFGIIIFFSIFDPQLKIDKSNTYIIVLVLFSMLGAILISYSKERGMNLGINESSGLMQRPDRIMVLGIAAVFDPVINAFIKFQLQLTTVNRYYALTFGLFLIAFLGNKTAITRIRAIWKKLNT